VASSNQRKLMHEEYSKRKIIGCAMNISGQLVHLRKVDRRLLLYFCIVGI
jgi:hypothetical protein